MLHSYKLQILLMYAPQGMNVTILEVAQSWLTFSTDAPGRSDLFAHRMNRITRNHESLFAHLIKCSKSLPVALSSQEHGGVYRRHYIYSAAATPSE